MDIIVEIGTEAQKELLRQEIIFIVDEYSHIDFHYPVQIVIPQDFQATSQKLLNDNNYQSNRPYGNYRVTVLGKTITTNEGVVIVLSSDLYTDLHDTMTRASVILHELNHVLNKQWLPKLENTIPITASVQYLAFLYPLFDEYVADRETYQAMDQRFNKPSILWVNYISNEFENFKKAFQTSTYFEKIKIAISKSRFHHDVDLFFNDIAESVSNILSLLAHTSAYCHHFSEIFSLKDIPSSYLLTSDTILLIDYLDKKYKSRDFDLSDGCEIAAKFCELFGFRLYDREDGYVFHPINIYP